MTFIHSHKIKIVSGGQTGVDRAALDVAIHCSLEHGGWCPKGRRAEDGIIDDNYHLQETESADYIERTRQNVEDSDGTLILNTGKLEGGTAMTLRFAEQAGKPVLVCDPLDKGEVTVAREWIIENNIYLLNIAGPRASKQKTIYADSYDFLKQLLIE